MKLSASAVVAIVILLGLSVSPIYAIIPTCKAGTISEVSQCIDNLNRGSVSTVEITNKISCNAAFPCRFNITSTSGGTIFGTPGSGAGFYRSGPYSAGAYGAPVFKISNTTNLAIANLTFDDSINDVNCPFSSSFFTDPTCSDQINVANSNGISFRELYMTNAKKQSIAVSQSNNISLVNSAVINSFTRGVVMDTVDGGNIEGNFIYDNGAAGLLNENAKNFTIKNNFFSKNQTHTPWNIGGGQINSRSENTTILGNWITEVSRPVAVENYGGSIELHVRNVNLTIRDNNFVNKLSDGFIVGPAIYNDPNGAVYSNVLIDNNRMDTGVDSTNRSAVYDWMGGNTWVWGNNCFNGSSGCTPSPYGTLSVDPNPCIIEPGKTSCSVSLSWYVNFAINTEVKVNGASFASSARGVQAKLNGITATPTPVTLWGDGKLLATVNVSATVPGTPAPTPRLGDLNNDGIVDINDYNILKADFGKTGTPGFIPSDLNKDGKVDVFDHNILNENYGSTSVTPPPTPVVTPTASSSPVSTPSLTPGDLNSDGVVDIADYNILKSNFGRTGTPGFIPSDINKDGKVDVFDHNILNENYGGTSVTPPPTPVVTPTASSSSTPAPKPGDLNSDGVVDIADYNILKADFGKTGTPGFIPADINKDGRVDIFDHNIINENYGG